MRPLHALTATAAAFSMSAAACARSEREGSPAAETAAAATSVQTTPAATTPAAATSGGERWVLTARGLGPLRAGMTLADAAAAVGGALTAPAGAADGCAHAAWRGGPRGVAVMMEGGRVARVELDSGSVATAEGARIGDSEARVRALYGPRVTVTPHKYTAGHYLTVKPAAASDSGYAIVFETDEGGRVAKIRAGGWPAVGYVEGCG